MTMLKPKWMERTVAKIALSTEAQPLMPQAHGIKRGFKRETLDNPSGKGMPIKKAKGAISRMEAGIFH